MKKLMFAAVAALAMVGAANAAQSYGIYTDSWVSPYSKDTNPGDEHSGWYSCYVMKQEDAQKAMGTTETVTYSDMATWLGKNFADNKEAVIKNAEEIGYDMYLSVTDQYGFFKTGINVSDLWSAIGVFFYEDNAANLAYNVMPNSGEEGSCFWFDDQYSAGSGWVAAPEPTSGLLMLLGIAGLALKRKRA